MDPIIPMRSSTKACVLAQAETTSVEMQRRLDEAKMREQRALSAMAESDSELHAMHRQMAEKACLKRPWFPTQHRRSVLKPSHADAALKL